jgi:hypothetical protein
MSHDGELLVCMESQNEHIRQNDEYIRQYDKLTVAIWEMRLTNLYFSF